MIWKYNPPFELPVPGMIYLKCSFFSSRELMARILASNTADNMLPRIRCGYILEFIFIIKLIIPFENTKYVITYHMAEISARS